MLEYAFTVFIKIIILFIAIKNIGLNKYFIFNYIIIFIYFFNIINSKSVNALIKKVYIINNFKAKIVIGVDFIGLKFININIFKRSAYIGFYNVKIFITTKFFIYFF